MDARGFLTMGILFSKILIKKIKEKRGWRGRAPAFFMERRSK